MSAWSHPGSRRREFASAVFARCAGEVFLIKHKRLGLWLPVGGERQGWETPLETARRELREETGWEGDFPSQPRIPGEPPGWLGYVEKDGAAKGTHLIHCFVADVVQRKPLIACAEYDDSVWTSCASYLGDLAQQHVRILVRLALAYGGQ